MMAPEKVVDGKRLTRCLAHLTIAVERVTLPRNSSRNSPWS